MLCLSVEHSDYTFQFFATYYSSSAVLPFHSITCMSFDCSKKCSNKWLNKMSIAENITIITIKCKRDGNLLVFPFGFCWAVLEKYWSTFWVFAEAKESTVNIQENLMINKLSLITYYIQIIPQSFLHNNDLVVGPPTSFTNSFSN